MRIFASIAATAGWFALVLQAQLSVHLSLSKGESIAVALGRYFGYFTILTNLIVALALTMIALGDRGRWGRFFSKPKVLAGIGVNISIVAIVYSVQLRKLWHPQGAQLVADELLHDVLPVAFLLFWLLFIERRQVHWKDLPLWLVYPLLYFPYAIASGASRGESPYPFLDVAALGFPRVLLNAGMMSLQFLAVSALWLALDRLIPRSLSSKANA